MNCVIRKQILHKLIFWTGEIYIMYTYLICKDKTFARIWYLIQNKNYMKLNKTRNCK